VNEVNCRWAQTLARICWMFEGNVDLMLLSVIIEGVIGPEWWTCVSLMMVLSDVMVVRLNVCRALLDLRCSLYMLTLSGLLRCRTDVW
jgi:hypothetical protein